MTNFEKLKSITQDEAVEYMRNGLCRVYGNCCKNCPMNDDDIDYCMGDTFANWLEMPVKEP